MNYQYKSFASRPARKLSILNMRFQVSQVRSILCPGNGRRGESLQVLTRDGSVEVQRKVEAEGGQVALSMKLYRQLPSYQPGKNGVK